MSYILDALRKSDQQRQRGATPTLRSAQSLAASPEPRARWIYGVLAIVLAGGAFAIGWLHPWQTEPPVAQAGTVAPQPVVDAKPSDTMIATRSVVAQTPKESAPHQIASPAPVEAPAKGTSKQDVAEPVRSESGPGPIAQNRSKQKRSEPLSDTPRAPTVAQAEAAKPAPAPVDTGRAGPAEEKVPKLSELPAAIRQELPPMTITVHAYSRTPKDRLVGVNNKLLHEGESLTPELVLEKITPDGMIFAYKGMRFQRGVQ